MHRIEGVELLLGRLRDRLAVRRAGIVDEDVEALGPPVRQHAADLADEGIEAGDLAGVELQRRARAPSRAASASTASAAARLVLYVKIERTPRAARARTAARPSPRLPPVMMAIRVLSVMTAS